MFLNRKPKPYPHYFRGGNVFAKVTGDKSYFKSFVTADGTHGEATATTEIHTTAEIFTPKNGWREITSKDWDKHLEFVTAPKVSAKIEKAVKFVFECNGRQYWTYENPMDFPAGRFREMEIINIEFEARATIATIRGAFDKILEACNGTDIKLPVIISVAKQQQAAMRLLFDFSLFEKLASVMYFDDGEDLTTYDPGYNEAKIKMWREHGGVDFFLKMPISGLLPFGKISEEDFQSFLREQTVKLKLIQAGLISDVSAISTDAPPNL